MGNPLLLLGKHGQSVWYDNLNRALLVGGELRRLVEEDGVSGGTSNPSIFEKALGGSDVYDDHFRQLAAEGKDLDDIYDGLTVADIQQSADVFRSTYDRTQGADGYASLEVSPLLAYEVEGSVEAARRLFATLDRPNAMIKIPGTPEALPAIERCLAEGINVNVTLLFGVENYEQVAGTYIAALEKRLAANQPIDRVASVASFFVSRVDTLVDDKLQEMIGAAAGAAEREQLKSLLGRAGIANAKIAYAKFGEMFGTDRWRALAAKGARVQRCLWASTSTKNPEYRDVMYVEPFIGPETINTMPQVTLEAFRDHGQVASTIGEGLNEARETIARLQQVGIDFRAATDELQTQGVQLFADSFQNVMDTLRQKRDVLQSATGGGLRTPSRGDRG
jgi:transaldolase